MSKKKETLRVISILIIALLINSCRPAIPSPSPTSTQKPTLGIPTQTVTATQKLIVIPSSTVTLTPVPSVTAISTPPATFIPGPNIDIFYLANGAVHRFNLQSWAAEKLELSSSDIFELALSPDKQLMAFPNVDGLHIYGRPFTKEAYTIPTIGKAWNPVFGSDEYLAYSDLEGLKIYNLESKGFTLLKPHFRDPVDDTHDYYFSPMNWSPDGKWLWIGVEGWEWSAQLLWSAFTGEYTNYTACYTDVDWLPNSRAFVSSVIFSGYNVCGEEGGVNVIVVSENVLIEEQVYSERTGDIWSHESRYATWDPSGEKILFVQVSLEEEPRNRLLLLDYATKHVQELDHSQGKIISPKWSVDGEKVYYVVQEKEESSIIRVDLRTSEKNIIPHLAKDAVITAVISNDDWLLVQTFPYSLEPQVTFLINAASKGQPGLLYINEPDAYKKFIGIVPGR